MVSGEVRALHRRGAPEWEVVTGERFIVALGPGPVTAAVAAGLRPLAADAALELEPLIARIPLGARHVSAFALAWWPPGGEPLTAVVRSDAVIELSTASGTRRLEGLGILPWHLAEFREPHAVRLGAPGVEDARADAAAAPTGSAFRAAGVEWLRHPSAGEPHETAEPSRPVVSASRSVGAPRFRLAGGEPVEVSGVVLIGRRPAPPRIVDGPVELVTAEGAGGTVSATHLELRREGERLVATDLRSTNGTVVTTAAGSRSMRAGESIVVAAGAVLELGGDTIVEILPALREPAHPDRQVPE
jgi:hypothetical protein